VAGQDPRTRAARAHPRRSAARRAPARRGGGRSWMSTVRCWRAAIRVPLPRLRRHVRAEPSHDRVVGAVHLPARPRRHGEAPVHGLGGRPGVRSRPGRRPFGRRMLRRCLRLPL